MCIYMINTYINLHLQCVRECIVNTVEALKLNWCADLLKVTAGNLSFFSRTFCGIQEN